MTEKRGRKPAVPVQSKEVAVNEELIATVNQASNSLTELKTSYSNERDSLNQMIGRVQMGLAIGGFTNMVNLQTLKAIKESKTYRSLSGQTAVDGAGLPVENLGTWDGFCRALGVSREKIDVDLANLNAFGEEALEFFTAIGVGYRELRQYRKLPEDRKQELLEVAKSGDKEGFVELAEEIIAKHVKEKEAMQAEVANAEAERDATNKLLETKNKRIDQLDKEVVRIQNLSPDDDAKELIEAAAATMRSAQCEIHGHFRAALQALHDSASVEGKEQLMAGMVNQLIKDLMCLRDQFNLPDTVGDGRPQWMHWVEDQDRLLAEQENGTRPAPN